MTVLIIVTMAVGIAACMSAATIFAAFSGEPIPGRSNHLYVVTMDARTRITKNNPGYIQPNSLLGLSDAVALVDADRASTQVALADSVPEVSNPSREKSGAARGFLAYGPVLRELGVPLRFGRSWTTTEEKSHAPVVVIDSKLAIKLFSTADVVGRSVEIDNHLFRIIGVSAPWKPRMAFVDAEQGEGPGQNVQLFVPIGAALDAGVGPEMSGKCENNGASITFGSVDAQHCRWLEVWVSLETLSAAESYQHFLMRYAQTQHALSRFVYPPNARVYATIAWLNLNHVVPSAVSLNVIMTGAFLFLCMINVTGLLTARFLYRQMDAAIRRALGATRVQVFIQHLVEAGLLGLLGGLLALPLTWLGMWIVRKQPVAYAAAAQFHPVTFLILLALAIGVGIAVGILPAWRVCRLPPAVQIRRG